jgi:hypothetical protein
VIAARHALCGEQTRVRLPEVVPSRAVRRMHCASCAQDFETALVEELDEILASANGGSEPEPIVVPEPEPIVVPEPEPYVAPEPALATNGSFALPDFEMPMFGELRLPDADEITVEKVVEPEPVAAAEAPEELLVGELIESLEARPVVYEEAPAVDAVDAVEAPPEPVAPSRPSRRPRRRAEFKLPQVRLPQVKAPQIKLPQLSLPQLRVPRPAGPQVPRFELPRLPQLRLPRIDPQSPGWNLLTIPLAIASVIITLSLIQGDDAPVAPAVPAAATAPATEKAPSSDSLAGNGKGGAAAAGEASGQGSKDTHLVRGSTYSLALPAGWERVDSQGGAAFAAVAADGGADAQLWINEDPKLDFPTFINNSMQQLEALAGSAQIVERVPGPTPETTIVRLAADAPEGQPTYEVTLRAAGDYRYYLATSVQPGASTEAAGGADLIAGSFTPEAN